MVITVLILVVEVLGLIIFEYLFYVNVKDFLYFVFFNRVLKLYCFYFRG